MTPASRDPRRVMVVYGRNDAARGAVFAFLRSLGLLPIEWEEAVAATGSGSPHNLAAVRAAMGIAQAVVVIMTAEDQARLIGALAGSFDDEDLALRGQPRQNVLLEAGLALGIDSDRTILVEIGRIRRMSDVDGLNTVRLSNDSRRRQALRSRLETAGCDVNPHGVDWLDSTLAGDFDRAAVPWAPEPEAQSGLDVPRTPAAATEDSSTALAQRLHEELPRSVSLLDVTATGTVTADAIAERWQAKRESVRTTIGMGADGPIELDLRLDGPHTLIAGTTGSGKSVLLNAIACGLALDYGPDAVQFLFVDYKGGAAFQSTAALPHSSGLITDLHGTKGHRFTVSLNAELRRRERVLREAKARDVYELNDRSAKPVLPYLIILIDEFGTFARELPEIMDGLLSVGQRGRSLGFFMILATQRTSGSVTDVIRATTNLRISLRATSPSESESVLGVPDAAHIPRDLPGRGWIRVGHHELTPFQTAHTGSGLEAIVAACSSAARRLGTGPARPVVVAPLPADIDLASLPHTDDEDDVVIGVVDDPARQQQYPYKLSLSRLGNIGVFGAAGTGKTTTLATLAFALARGRTPSSLHVYGVEMTGRALARIESMPHCGTIVDGTDEERVSRLLTDIEKENARRHQLLDRARVSSFIELTGVPGHALPRIVVMIDDYEAFVDLYDRVEFGALPDALARVAVSGARVGLHLIVSASRSLGVPSRTAAALSERIVLRMAEFDEYERLGVAAPAARDANLPPGRGFVADNLAFQCASVGTGPPAWEAAAGKLAATVGGEPAPAVRVLERTIALADLPEPDDPLQIPIGLRDDDFEPAVADLRDSHFCVFGPYRSGRSSTLVTLAHGLLRFDGLDAVCLCPRKSPLRTLADRMPVITGREACADYLAMLIDTRDAESEWPPIAVLLDDANELDDSPALGHLLRHWDTDAFHVVAAMEPAAGRGYYPWIRELRRHGNGFLLDPNPDSDGELLNVRLPRSIPKMSPGRGYLVREGDICLAQVATANGDDGP